MMASTNGVDDRGDGHKIIPRNYQIELYLQCLDKNAIVYLGTGSGKTTIASLLIQEYYLKKKKMVFLVPTVPLLYQQGNFFSVQCPDIKIGKFCGPEGVDFWKEAEWKQQIRESDLLLMVFQVFLDALSHNYISLNDVSIVIIDECHHATKNSPLNQIFREHYTPFKENVLSGEPPRIVGLTASIVLNNCNSSNFLIKKRELEKNLDSRVITTENLAEYINFATKPDERFEYFDTSNNKTHGPWTQIINKTIDQEIQDFKEKYIEDELLRCNFDKAGLKLFKESVKRIVSKYTRILNQTQEIFSELGFKPGLDHVNDLLNNTISSLRLTSSSSRLEDALINIVDNALKSIKTLCLNNQFEDFDYLSPKVLKLLKLLREFPNRTTEKLSGIVFVKQRCTAKSLYQILMDARIDDPNLNYIKVSYAVGQATRDHLGSGNYSTEMKYNRETKEEMENLIKNLNKFKTGTKNLIISTEVLEEGMDVKKCNFVLRFDRIPNFKSYVQSKGRARAKPSQFIILLNRFDDRQSEENKIIDYRELEDLSISECHNDVSEEELEDDYDRDAFIPNPDDPNDGRRIGANQAVGLIHKYVQQSLTTDRFTILAPYWETVNVNGGNDSVQNALLGGIGFEFISTLYMPHGCPIREPIIGPKRFNKKSAKQAVSIMAVEMLYDMKELCHNLNPRRKKRAREDDEDDDDKNVDPRLPKVGTKRNRRYYSRENPLYQQDDDGKSRYLYSIDMELVEEYKSNSKDYIVDDPVKHPIKLGICTLVEIPFNALNNNFPLYTRSGLINVKINYKRQINNIGDIITGKFRENMELFFIDVLKLFPSEVYRFNFDLKDYVIVPLNEKYEILDIDFTVPKKLSLNSVVMPIHKNDNQRYFVEEITNLTPSCIMSGYQTFGQYYEEKYDRKIKDTNQNLIRVSNADKKYFSFKSVMNHDKRQKHFNIRNHTLFIPELVEIHSIDSELWKDLQILPFVIQRLQGFIMCDSLFLRWNEFLTPGPKMNKNEKRSPDILFKVFTLQTETNSYYNYNLNEFMECLTFNGCDEENNLERKEILGDSFLKYCTSLFLYDDTSNYGVFDEGTMTSFRSKIVGNKNLFRIASEFKLGEKVNAVKFEPHVTWLPSQFKPSSDNLEKHLAEFDLKYRNSLFMKEIADVNSINFMDGVTVEDLIKLGKENTPLTEFYDKMVKKLKNKDNKIEIRNPIKLRTLTPINDKGLADVIEALIGFYLETTGPIGALKFMASIGLNFGRNNNRTNLTHFNEIKNKWDGWKDLPLNAFHSDKEPDQKSLNILYERLNLNILEKKIGYRFKERSFILMAMTHSSYSFNKVTDSYERLEFLGDAVLDYLVTCYIYCHYPHHTPGQVTDARSALVDNNAFAGITCEHKLYSPNHFLCTSSRTMDKINEYVSYYHEIKDTNIAQVELMTTTRELLNETEVPTLEDVEVPKVMGDIFEALIGAIFLDSGGSTSEVWKVYKRLQPNLDDYIQNKPKNFVKQLYEKYPKKVEFGKTTENNELNGKVERIVKVTIGSRERKFRGIGNNKKRAKQAAAKCALNHLKKDKLINYH